jgi:hypothetical protein
MHWNLPKFDERTSEYWQEELERQERMDAEIAEATQGMTQRESFSYIVDYIFAPEKRDISPREIGGVNENGPEKPETDEEGGKIEAAGPS